MLAKDQLVVRRVAVELFLCRYRYRCRLEFVLDLNSNDEINET
jgi:hypothetical protein